MNTNHKRKVEASIQFSAKHDLDTVTTPTTKCMQN